MKNYRYSYWYKIYNKFFQYYLCWRLEGLIRRNKIKEAVELLSRSYDEQAFKFVGNLKSVGARDVLIGLACRRSFLAKKVLSVFSASMRREGILKYLEEFILNHKTEELTNLFMRIDSNDEFKKDLDAVINKILSSSEKTNIKVFIKLAFDEKKNWDRCKNNEFKRKVDTMTKEQKLEMKFCPKCNKEILSDFYREDKCVGEWEVHTYYYCKKCRTELNNGFGQARIDYRQN